jgi:hypothetical protein
LLIAQYARAAAAVSGVPTNYVFNAEAPDRRRPDNGLQRQHRTITVSDRGRNGLNFVSAQIRAPHDGGGDRWHYERRGVREVRLATAPIRW